MSNFFVEVILYGSVETHIGAIEEIKKGKTVNISKIANWFTAIVFVLYIIIEILFTAAPFTTKKIFIISAISFGSWLFIYAILYLCTKYYKKKNLKTDNN